MMRRTSPATTPRRSVRKNFFSLRRAVAPLREIIFFFSDSLRGRVPPATAQRRSVRKKFFSSPRADAPLREKSYPPFAGFL